MSEYETCLPDIESILPQLAKIISAKYDIGKFCSAEDAFIESKKICDEWSIIGQSNIRVSVLFEQYEGYFFLKINGDGKEFIRAKEFLHSEFLKCGGDPDA